MTFSTIAAIGTPRGKGGVAIIRISGPEALVVADRVFSPINQSNKISLMPRTQVYGNLLSYPQGEVLDDGLATYFPSPHSFTGEDVVELACHGGEVISSMVLNAVLSAGATLAQAGEFTRRSFLNGKMSLTKVEGVADLLDAKTESAALLSSKTARGKLSTKIKELSDEVLLVASSLWAYLDYPEEDLQTLDDNQYSEHLNRLIDRCHSLLDTFRIGKAVSFGISAVIVGKPNVGKSTFFNLLLGEERAIVTSLPGTTRDVIEYPVKIGPLLLNLSDTAGVRSETGDVIEKIGIVKTLECIDDAEMVFALFDSSRPLDDDDRMILQKIQNHTKDRLVLTLLTKSDLPTALDRSLFPDDVIFINATESLPMDVLESRISDHFISDDRALREGEILTNVRQKDQLNKAIDYLISARDEILTGAKDVASISLESALSALLAIDGNQAGEQILDQVFSRFCIGK